MKAQNTRKFSPNNWTEKEEYILSVTFAIIGLAALYYSTQLMDPANVNTEEIDESMLGDSVKTSGSVEDVFNYENHQFFDLEDETGAVSVANFDYNKRVDEGDKITVKGTVDMYEGDIQIIVDDLEF